MKFKDYSPSIAREWDYKKNGQLNPDTIGHGSTKKVFWICPEGHSYQARIDHRTIMHSGCPYCAGKLPIVGQNDLATLYPDIAKEWDYEKNTDCPDNYLPQSNKLVSWKCPYCELPYKKRIDARVRNRVGCPNCAKEKGTSFQEQSFLFYLSRVAKAEGRNRDYGCEIDIYLPELMVGIEYNGKYYHKSQKIKDQQKQELLKKQGVRLISIVEDEKNHCEGDVIELKCSDTFRMDDPDLEWGIRTVFDMLGLVCPSINVKRDQIAIKEQYIISRKENSFAKRYPELANEWNTEKNGKLRPENFTCGSSHRAFFNCPVCKTVYPQKIANRTRGMGCPVCAGKQVKKGYNDLLTKYPEVARPWGSRNLLAPDECLPGSDRKVWWQCDKCGQEWQATISSRTLQKVGCPVCAGKVVLEGYNDFATLFPLLAKEWNTEKNGELRPEAFTAGSNKVVQWKCPKCGKEWPAAIASRIRGRGCPECGIKNRTQTAQLTRLKTRGSLEDHRPDLAKEWDWEENGSLSPSDVTVGSKEKVGWICSKGHKWKAVVYSRKKNGCPECAKERRKT